VDAILICDPLGGSASLRIVGRPPCVFFWPPYTAAALHQRARLFAGWDGGMWICIFLDLCSSIVFFVPVPSR